MKPAEVAYEVVRSERKTADIVIERDGRVLVRAPHHVAEDRIEEIVEGKRYWIYKNLAEWRDLNDAVCHSLNKLMILSGKKKRALEVLKSVI